MKISKEVGRNQVIPAWYGIAWIKLESDTAICYPMPFNLIVSALRSLVIFVRHGYMIVPCNARDAYNQGFKDGKKLIQKYYEKAR